MTRYTYLIYGYRVNAIEVKHKSNNHQINFHYKKLREDVNFSAFRGTDFTSSLLTLNLYLYYFFMHVKIFKATKSCARYKRFTSKAFIIYIYII